MANIICAKNAIQALFEDLLDVHNGKIEPGIMTGLRDFDSILGGFQKRKLVVFAAPPSIGLTSFLLNVIKNVTMEKQAKKVLLCSSDLDAKQVISRLVCLEAKMTLLSAEPEITGKSIKQLTNAVSRLRDIPLWIDPSCGIFASSLMEKIGSFAKETQIDLCVIDSLNYLKHENVNKTMGEFKLLAEKLEIPIVVLCPIFSRKNKISVTDLPVGVADNADALVFLERKRCKRISDDKPSLVNITVERNKFGRTGTVRLRFLPELMLFEDEKSN